MGQRIGLFGGTFDPPHLGHLAVAIAARDALELDRTLLVVANQPWQKVGHRPVTEARHRLAMTELLVQNSDGLEVSDLEIVRGGMSYTIDTVKQLQEAGHEVVLIMGADAAAGIDSWERATELSRLTRIAVVDRPGYDMPELANWSVDKIAAQSIRVSSSQVRSSMSEGSPAADNIPSAVRRYIDLHHLEWPAR
ncbi:MAG TPA: nicotinate (nicotinamide) nucleotide adenylyltransferase [Acidimicrobiaceae bacterium]|nr:nicotinate (nicotinamide) nucleotide adenylyltransferase [Acidimicrobiaceae bacterium]|tara:strand:- start:7008 stop:7589 length:582 start_codon:yes stop_codon:yes gene_type:complete